MTRDIEISNQYQRLKFSEADVINTINIFDQFEKYSLPDGDLSIAFISDESIASLHDEFLNDATPTDVITFIGDPDMQFAGEICISVDHAIKSAQELALSVQEELTLYIIHGCLHLAGLNDLNEDDKKQMRSAETETMDYLKSKAAIPDFNIEIQ